MLRWLIATLLFSKVATELNSNNNTRKAFTLSPEAESKVPSCYKALNYHILDNSNRLDVEELSSRQFSLSLNKTYLRKDRLTQKCAFVWIRIAIVQSDVKTADLVDSNTDLNHPDLVSSRFVLVKIAERFPVRNFVRGIFVGYSDLLIQGVPFQYLVVKNISQIPDDEWVTLRNVNLATLRKIRFEDDIFQLIVICLIILGNVGIGLDVNWEDVRAIIVRPIGPVIGFCCQFIIMPITGFTVVTLIHLPENIALGIFLMGCAPGGGGSNYHTYFLGGNLALSVTMTFVSTVSAFFMMPFWVYTLGRVILNSQQSGLTIDFRGIAIALLNSVVPFMIGIFINWRHRKLAKKIFRVFVRPMLMVIFIYLVTAGAYTNAYILELLTAKVLMAGVCLPYVGFTCGFLIALLAKQDKASAITIAVETGVQSVGIALATLMLSLPKPDADLAIAGPIAVLLFTPVPLWIVEITRGFYLCYKRKGCYIDACRKKLKTVDTTKHHSQLEPILPPSTLVSPETEKTLLEPAVIDEDGPAFSPGSLSSPITPIDEEKK